MTATGVFVTTETQAAFARRIGVARSLVSALKDAGKIAVDEKDMVDVDATAKLLVETATGKKVSSAERWAADYLRQRNNSEKVNPDDFIEQQVGRRADSVAVREYYDAELRKIDYLQRSARLMPTEDVVAAVADAATTLRTGLEALPDLLAPQLVAIGDETQARAVIADHVEILLGELCARFAALAKAPA